jgi:beta-RFAP synthase
MPTMKIRGGDLDLVEYEFTSFEPGERIKTLGISRPVTREPLPGIIRVRAPARIHLTVLDMNRFAPNRPGGGGIGFAIGVYCEAEVRAVPDGLTIDYTRQAIIRHFVSVFKEVTGYRGGFEITARDHKYKHVGLGSTSTVLTAVATAMNRAVGSPLGRDEIRLLIGNNYIEETEGGRIVSGFETGVGPAVSTYGGLAVMGDALTLAYNHPFAEGAQVHIIIPPTPESSAGDQEFNLLMNRARTLDYRDRELKAYLALMDLIPAVETGDLNRAGDIIWEMDFRGSKRAEVEHHSFDIYTYMSAIRTAGFEFVGMSSVGPSIAVITTRPKEDLEPVLSKMGITRMITTHVDNTGLVVTGDQ